MSPITILSLAFCLCVWHIRTSESHLNANPINKINGKSSSAHFLGTIERFNSKYPFHKSFNVNINKTKIKVEKIVTDMEQLCLEPEIAEYDALRMDCANKHLQIVEKGDLLLRMLRPYEKAPRGRRSLQSNQKKLRQKTNAQLEKIIGGIELIVTPVTPQKWLEMITEFSESELEQLTKNIVSIKNDVSNKDLTTIREEFARSASLNGSVLINLALEKIIAKSQSENPDYNALSSLNKQKLLSAIMDNLSRNIINNQSFIMILNRTSQVTENSFPCIINTEENGENEYFLATATTQIVASVDMEFKNGIVNRILRRHRRQAASPFSSPALNEKRFRRDLFRYQKMRVKRSLITFVGRIVGDAYSILRTVVVDGALFIFTAGAYGIAYLGRTLGFVSEYTVSILASSFHRRVEVLAPLMSFVRNNVATAILGTSVLIAYPALTNHNSVKRLEATVQAYEKQKADRDASEKLLFDSIQKSLKLSIDDRTKIEEQQDARTNFLMQYSRIIDVSTTYINYLMSTMRTVHDIPHEQPIEEVKDSIQRSNLFKIADMPVEKLLESKRIYQGKSTIEIMYDIPIVYIEFYYLYVLIMVPTTSNQLVFQNRKTIQYIAMKQNNATMYALDSRPEYYFKESTSMTPCELNALKGDQDLSDHCDTKEILWNSEVQPMGDNFHVFYNPHQKQLNVICDKVQETTRAPLIYSTTCSVFDVLIESNGSK